MVIYCGNGMTEAKIVDGVDAEAEAKRTSVTSVPPFGPFLAAQSLMERQK